MERTQALGNAIVPQIAELIGRAIMAHDAALVQPLSTLHAGGNGALWRSDRVIAARGDRSPTKGAGPHVATA
jgi:hypothetical protein